MNMKINDCIYCDILVYKYTYQSVQDCSVDQNLTCNLLGHCKIH